MTPNGNKPGSGRLGGIDSEDGGARVNRTMASRATDGEKEVIVIHEPHNGAAYVAAEPDTAVNLDAGDAR